MDLFNEMYEMEAVLSRFVRELQRTKRARTEKVNEEEI